MARMTMHQELDMLRSEVEELRKQKEDKETMERAEAKKAEKAHQQNIEDAEEKAEEITETVEGVEDEAKAKLDDLLETIKKDYENLSPVAAVVLFALGAAFGRALYSK